MHLEASDPSFIDALITPNAGRNDRLDRLDASSIGPKSQPSSTTSTPPPKAGPPIARPR